jgi:hypothetical protein
MGSTEFDYGITYLPSHPRLVHSWTQWRLREWYLSLKSAIFDIGRRGAERLEVGPVSHSEGFLLRNRGAVEPATYSIGRRLV